MLTLPPLAACSAQDEAPPFSVAAGLFDQKKVRSRSAPRPVIGKDGAQVGGIIEQDPHFCDGRLHAVFHLRPGLILKPYYTDDPLGIGGWIGGNMQNLPYEPPTSRTRAKHRAGNLPDGTAFLVNAPHAGRGRAPLALTLSADGRVFDRSFLLRGASDLQSLRYEGRYKRSGYHYPKSVVAYATNKEGVEVTRVPLSSLGP